MSDLAKTLSVANDFFADQAIAQVSAHIAEMFKPLTTAEQYLEALRFSTAQADGFRAFGHSDGAELWEDAVEELKDRIKHLAH